ncbi:MAG: DNA repair protein RadC [Deltaproteobacteria bacterium]|nr:DNA repair protein RadC [Deltaproteobacteria bacterium]MBW2086029.1 DNA repair protein RadC [Deltaproteobacteria bacterium]
MANEKEKDPRLGHRQRLKDKFRQHGLEKFTDEEIIELLLTFGTPRKDCKQTARDLLKKFGSIPAIFDADLAKLTQVKNIGPNNPIAIKFIAAVAGTYLKRDLIGRDYLASSKKVFQYLQHDLENLPKEVFKVIYLDGANGVIGIEDLSQGTVGAANVHPRELIERALARNAAGLVFAHNHPSGSVRPSPNDFRLTRQLIHAARLVEISVIDHIIVGRGGKYFSFRDQGHLARYETEFKQFYYARD